MATGARNLVNAEAVTKTFGTRTVLDAVSLGVAAGERIGVVGRNGDGKSTLVRVLAGHEPVDGGRVTHTGGLRTAVLPQHDALDPRATVRQAVLGAAAAHEWAGDARVREVLAGLFGGLELPGLPDGLDAVVAELSGGERQRVSLAAVLVRDDDLLFLDEPTNHLDVEAVDWLIGHLVQRGRGLVCVTHDRYLLDTVCTRTWEVSGGQVHDYEGGYSAYVLARAERQRFAGATEARRQNVLRKELAWLRRGPPARTTKPPFRVEAANALIAQEPPVRDALELTRFATARLGKTVIDVHDATLRVGDRTLLDRFSWQLGPGDRVGVVGVNGSGKTSLLRMLAGALRPVAGRVVHGTTVRAAYLPQEIQWDVDGIDPAARVLEAVESVRRVVQLGPGGSGGEVRASSLLERFGFAGQRQWTRVRELSGGERRRVQLLRLLMGEPNVLLLDEPTNDLDIETLTVLEDLLDGWAGSLVVVSHDRYFVERVCDRVVALLGDGALRDLPGGVTQYMELRRAMLAAPRTADARGERAAVDTRAARKELTRIERALERLTLREKDLHEQLATHATDYQRVSALDAELADLRSGRDDLEQRWLEAAEQADR